MMLARVTALRGVVLEITLHSGKPGVRVICRACGQVDFCRWQRLKPGSTLTCHRCGRRVPLPRRVFVHLRNLLESRLRTHRFETESLYSPRLWEP